MLILVEARQQSAVTAGKWCWHWLASHLSPGIERAGPFVPRLTCLITKPPAENRQWPTKFQPDLAQRKQPSQATASVAAAAAALGISSKLALIGCCRFGAKRQATSAHSIAMVLQVFVRACARLCVYVFRFAPPVHVFACQMQALPSVLVRELGPREASECPRPCVCVFA